MIRTTAQFFYTEGPRVAIKSPLTRERIAKEIIEARETGDLLMLESLPENPRDETGSAYVYLDMVGIAFISLKEEKEQPSKLVP